MDKWGRAWDFGSDKVCASPNVPSDSKRRTSGWVNGWRIGGVGRWGAKDGRTERGAVGPAAWRRLTVPKTVRRVSRRKECVTPAARELGHGNDS